VSDRSGAWPKRCENAAGRGGEQRGVAEAGRGPSGERPQREQWHRSGDAVWLDPSGAQARSGSGAEIQFGAAAAEHIGSGTGMQLGAAAAGRGRSGAPLHTGMRWDRDAAGHRCGLWPLQRGGPSTPHNSVSLSTHSCRERNG
jgi:hypothetical protein